MSADIRSRVRCHHGNAAGPFHAVHYPQGRRRWASDSANDLPRRRSLPSERTLRGGERAGRTLRRWVVPPLLASARRFLRIELGPRNLPARTLVHASRASVLRIRRLGVVRIPLAASGPSRVRALPPAPVLRIVSRGSHAPCRPIS